MSKPRRIQLSRKKGWRMPPNTVKVDRTTIWGNPYVVGLGGRAEAVSMFRFWITRRAQAKLYRSIMPALRGKNLACWCPLDQPCHADVLLEAANK